MAKKDINWGELGFSYMTTDSFIKVSFKDGKWGAPESIKDPMITLHVAATALHYGQAAFEGLKVFTKKDGTVSAFRPEENAKRLNRSAERIIMEPVPEEVFMGALSQLVKENNDFIPPHGSGASFYVRPLLIGAGARIGVQPADEYDLYMLGMPVGPYYKNGFIPIEGWIQTNFDRAAPNGVGSVKAGGNYAAGMMGDREGKKSGYPISLYLDSAEHKYIDEFGTSNFIGITADNKYVTPSSASILPSITNSSLQELAEDIGLTVEKRQVPVEELADFIEVGSCGTAAVITPIYSIVYGEKKYTFGEKDIAGASLTKLYDRLLGTQYGEVEDVHGWMVDFK
jgi:branched-chain amino acid aminotransferase